MACPWAMPTEASGLPVGCQGLPRHALVCAMASHGLSMACLGVCHGMPMGCHGLPRHALVCAMASPWGAMACHGLPWCVPWAAHGVPRLAMACLGVWHGKPWAATTCLGVCHGKPWVAHGMPWCVPRKVMPVPNFFWPVQISQIVILNSLYDTCNVSHASNPTHYPFSIFYDFLYFFN